MADGIGSFVVAAWQRFGGMDPRRRLLVAIHNWLPLHTMGSVRIRLLRLAGIAVGSGSGVAGTIRLGGGPSPASRLLIGSWCFINDGCRFDVTAPVTLEDNVYLGHEVAILSATHEIAGPDQRAGHTIGRPVTVDGVPGSGPEQPLLGGVTIGAGSIVAAGAVVVRSTKPNTVVGGVPGQRAAANCP